MLEFTLSVADSRLNEEGRQTLLQDYYRTFYPTIDFSLMKEKDHEKQMQSLEEAMEEFSKLRFSPTNDLGSIPESIQSSFKGKIFGGGK